MSELLYAIYMGDVPIDMASSLSTADRIAKERSVPHMGKEARVAVYRFQGWVPPPGQLDLPFSEEDPTG